MTEVLVLGTQTIKICDETCSNTEQYYISTRNTSYYFYVSNTLKKRVDFIIWIGDTKIGTWPLQPESNINLHYLPGTLEKKTFVHSEDVIISVKFLVPLSNNTSNSPLRLEDIERIQDVKIYSYVIPFEVLAKKTYNPEDLMIRTRFNMKERDQFVVFLDNN